MLLYQRPTSGHSYKVRLLLSFLSVEHDEIEIRASDGRNVVDPSYFELNPRGQVPTLEDDGVVLWGSTAILVYLASRFDAARTWFPVDARRAAEVTQWLELAQNEVNGLFLSRAIQKFGYPGDLAAAQRAGNRALDILEQRLARSRWLAGDGPSIGDIACFPYAAVADDNGFDLEARPALNRWFERMAGIEGFVPMPGMEPLLARLGRH
ncbi:MAG TPA: glutathione S-transferase family protein [Burkholderiaceae bacterium]